MSRFNENQLEAITTTSNVAVVAGPGSGKTGVIIEKIGRLLSSNPKTGVCAVTFTRDAANELPERLKHHFPNPKIIDRFKYGTFHSLAIAQLRDAGLLGQLATPQQQSAFINLAARFASTPDEPITYEEASMRIEAAKCMLVHDPVLFNDPVVKNYQNTLKRNKVSDLYDVIRNAVLGMRDGTVKPISINGKLIEHLLVDEYQDSDEVQYAWVMEYVKLGVTTMVVADDDQTIYEWRRALGYKGILQFMQEANAHQIVLGQNYRCHAEILQYADTLIRNNAGHRIEKRLIAEKGPGGEVELLRGANVEDQAYELVMKFEPFLIPCDDVSGRFDFTIPEKSGSIIARNHIILNSVESILLEKGIKYQRSGGGFWKQYFLVIFAELLRSIQKGTSSGIDMALGFAGCSDGSLQKLHEACPKFSDFLDGKLGEFPDVDKDDLLLLQRFSGLSTAWRNQLRSGEYSLVIRGVAAFIKDEGLNKAADKERRKSLNKAVDILISYDRFRINMANGSRSMSIAERIDLALKPRPSEPDGIHLHTMHSCKGLEFENVGVIQVSQGVLPNEERPDDINDRRLIYVAYTRAKRRLWVSYEVSKFSRFLHESGFSNAPT